MDYHFCHNTMFYPRFFRSTIFFPDLTSSVHDFFFRSTIFFSRSTISEQCQDPYDHLNGNNNHCLLIKMCKWPEYKTFSLQANKITAPIEEHKNRMEAQLRNENIEHTRTL